MAWRRQKDWRAEDVLAKQVAMNRQTWEALKAHGVTEQTELRLDFAYEAPGREQADTLASYLREETDYDVVADDKSVTGSTQPTGVSPEILDEWVV